MTLPDLLEEYDEEVYYTGMNKEPSSKEDEYTGGSSDYYKIRVEHPTTLKDPYDVECNDIIEALDMTFAEGNAFKGIWRRCAARKGKRKRGYDNGLYDAEKVKFFGERMIVQSKQEE